MVGVDCVFTLAGGPATALLTGADGCAGFAGGVAVVNCWWGCRCECGPDRFC